ncbi:MAG: hypothetical protein FJZ01_21330 [Candidatus Sericytochromatia bacterium]|nr:hypothetical protein [Candidatus Tanganyikabacteria bacterium]
MEALQAFLARALQAIAANPALVWGLVLASIGLAVIARTMTALARQFRTCPGCRRSVPVADDTCRYCRAGLAG